MPFVPARSASRRVPPLAPAPSLGRPGSPALGQPGSPTPARPGSPALGQPGSSKPARPGAPGPARCPGRLRPLAVAALLALVALFGPLAGGGRPALAEDFVPAPPPAEQLPEGLREVGVTERLGETLPLDVRLRDEAGREVTLGAFVAGKKPLLLQFVYHSCPTLCSLVSSGMVASLRELPLTVGDEFEVLTVSIDANDTPAVAAEKKQQALKVYGRGGEAAAAGWHFLTGEADEVRRLANAAGFTYRYEEAEKQFAHSAALFVLSPTGKLARYLYGIEFPPLDLRLALAEAAAGRTVTSAVDHLLLYCYRYDPLARSYVFFAINVMRAGSALTVLLLSLGLFRLWRREARGPQGLRAFPRPGPGPAAPPAAPAAPSPRG